MTCVLRLHVVLDTTKVQIFKQITTTQSVQGFSLTLFQIPQRYRFSSKSQLLIDSLLRSHRCFRYHKGTDFQANHNRHLCTHTSLRVVLDTTKVQIFKQITTICYLFYFDSSCFRYHKGTDFQANHNTIRSHGVYYKVVLDTTKVQIFKQITTYGNGSPTYLGCFRYHKGTDFQANHNQVLQWPSLYRVVLDTTKVQIFKQITTASNFMIDPGSCFRYHKGTDFQANHNCRLRKVY